MTTSALSPPPRRPDVERAFAHIAALASDVDLSNVADPLQQWVLVLRQLMKRYGDVGEPTSLDGIRVTFVDAGGVPAEWVVAAGADPQRRIVYTHGGGWAGGSTAEYRPLAATLSRLSGASVLLVDYRLAPEHRFPAGLDDCVRAFSWAAEHGPAGTQHAQSLSLAGDSAGANLAAATCLRLIASGARIPDRLALLAGTLDNTASAERVGIDDPIVPPESLAASLLVYLPAGTAATDPLVSPVYASVEQLKRFPPTLLQASRSETLLYDTRRFARRLEEAGVRHVLSIWPALPHVWQVFLGLIPESHEALLELADFINPHRGASR